MQLFTLVFSIAILVMYVVLSQHSSIYTLLGPRGGIVTLAISLLLANAAVWAALQPQRTLNERFQLMVAAWIWLLVQAGGIVYSLSVP